MRIVLKELNETGAWLQLISETEFFPRQKMAAIISEGRELTYIVAASIKTARSTQP
jgi:four helix bundle protein